MEKICLNCKYFIEAGHQSCCTHKDHEGTLVPPFTTCKQFEAKKPRLPFDNIKLISDDFGSVTIYYICEKCGKEMKEPASWQIGSDKPLDGPLYRFYCKDCAK